MSSDILLQSGDLVEFTHPRHDVRIRGVVRGFEITESHQTGEDSLSIWIYQGREDLKHVMSKKKEDDKLEVSSKMFEQGQNHVEKGLVCWGWSGLRSWDLEVIRRGNSPREMTNFMID